MCIPHLLWYAATITRHSLAPFLRLIGAIPEKTKLSLSQSGAMVEESGKDASKLRVILRAMSRMTAPIVRGE